MTKIVLLILSLTFFTSCGLFYHCVGCKKDEYGCNPSTGFTWSELKQFCVPLWKMGERLELIEINSIHYIRGKIIFNDDKSKAELFLPHSNIKNVILLKSEKGKYRFKKYLFDPKNETLFIDGKAEYRICSQ